MKLDISGSISIVIILTAFYSEGLPPPTAMPATDSERLLDNMRKWNEKEDPW